ncbi:Putative isopenicillin-N synthase [Corynebacterium glyciniphilum AJ 3170]|uniref:Putative isopenicillin-N synthase n=1 Tax=Corynebacterium glyciniphilum AJ 3170 TaxID=1404245 RepID=X5E7N3_9CORY|nr:2-oxoglutarate and iron-dependent oxygenase domain-containing protein [Corynebacterium glyciniphilum]AHW62696.1 Putative isopenicillin-N synthase [Corynebacterium glyciniphilum AJ 3170]
MSITVPVIDISPYLHVSGGLDHTDPAVQEARAAVARQLDEACTDVGFLQIIGHGIPSDVEAGLAGALDDFFGQPLDAKKSYTRPGENRGYSPPKSESLSMSLGVASANQMNDFYEAITVGSERSWFPGLELPETSYPDNSWPTEITPSFRPAVEAWFREASRVSRALLTAFTDALNLSSGYFDEMVDHSIDALKMNHYTLPEGDIDLTGELTGMGAHTDFGILTVLWADRVPGLQVLDREGAWHAIEPAEGALIVNLGDAMARWTNDRWMSTVHRVDPPVVNGRIIRRRSAAFFFDGNHDAVIETLPGCEGAAAGDCAAGYPPITVADNINAKLAGMKDGIAPSDAGREAARVTSAS